MTSFFMLLLLCLQILHFISGCFIILKKCWFVKHEIYATLSCRTHTICSKCFASGKVWCCAMMQWCAVFHPSGWSQWLCLDKDADIGSERLVELLLWSGTSCVLVSCYCQHYTLAHEDIGCCWHILACWHVISMLVWRFACWSGSCLLTAMLLCCQTVCRYVCM